ncbi:MAG: hypothetical protein NWP87_06225 [Winogradskyella sp.]|nr:hypothetical protein [Winogradskyella sp.]
MTLSKSNLKVILLSITICYLTSCSKDNSPIVFSEVTEEEAAELIETSLQKSTGGLNEITKTYSEELTTDITLNESCDTAYEESFTYSYNTNSIQADYLTNWSYEMTCTDLDVPESVVFEASSAGNYTTTRIVSEDTMQTSASISGLQPSSQTLIFNGSFKREGAQEITINLNTRSLSSSLKVDFTNLIVDKSTYAITSGTGTASLMGINQNNSFSFEGTVVFNGNGSATLTLNGNSYQIDIN